MLLPRGLPCVQLTLVVVDIIISTFGPKDLEDVLTSVRRTKRKLNKLSVMFNGKDATSQCTRVYGQHAIANSYQCCRKCVPCTSYKCRMACGSGELKCFEKVKSWLPIAPLVRMKSLQIFLCKASSEMRYDLQRCNVLIVVTV